MKKLLLVAFVLTAANLYSQEFQPDLNKLIARSKLSSIKKDTSKPTLRHPFTLDLKMLAPKSFNREPGVHALPQDGMPCIVPDTKRIAAMPNAATKHRVPPANRIPNATPEQRLLPKSDEWSR
jgi:hypothetical protein